RLPFRQKARAVPPHPLADRLEVWLRHKEGPRCVPAEPARVLFQGAAGLPRRSQWKLPVARSADKPLLLALSSRSAPPLPPGATVAGCSPDRAARFVPSRTERLRRGPPAKKARRPSRTGRWLPHRGSDAAGGRRNARCALVAAEPNSNAKNDCKEQ